MKKAMLAVAMLAGVSVFAGDNLLKNPGFEKADAIKYKESDKYCAESLAGWSISDWSGKPKDGSKRGKVGLKTHTDASEGKASGHLYTTGEKRGNLLIYQSITLTPGKEQKYILSFKFKKADPKNDNNVSVFASYLTYKREDKKSKRLAYKHSKRLNATAEWQTIEFPITVSAEAETMQLLLRANGNGGVLFDETVFKAVD